MLGHSAWPGSRGGYLHWRAPREVPWQGPAAEPEATRRRSSRIPERLQWARTQGYITGASCTCDTREKGVAAPSQVLRPAGGRHHGGRRDPKQRRTAAHAPGRKARACSAPSPHAACRSHVSAPGPSPAAEEARPPRAQARWVPSRVMGKARRAGTVRSRPGEWWTRGTNRSEGSQTRRLPLPSSWKARFWEQVRVSAVHAETAAVTGSPGPAGALLGGDPWPAPRCPHRSCWDPRRAARGGVAGGTRSRGKRTSASAALGRLVQNSSAWRNWAPQRRGEHRDGGAGMGDTRSAEAVSPGAWCSRT